MSGRPEVAAVAARLAGDVDRLVARLEIPVTARGPELWGRSTKEGGPGDGFSIRRHGDKAGVWHNRGTGEKGDAIGLIKWWRRCDFPAAMVWALDHLGIAAAADLPPAPARPPADRRSDEDRRDYALGLWNRARPAAGTPAELYLRNRGIAISPPYSIRYHPSLRHSETGKARNWPVLLAAVADVERKILGVWRIYLERDAAGLWQKAFSVADAKKGLGPVAGGAVRLTMTRPRLYVTEGVETGLAVAQRHPDVAVWAALSTGGLVSLELPDEVVEVVIYGDADAVVTNPNSTLLGKRPGRHFAERAADRFRRGGRSVAIVEPGAGDGTDFLDVFGGR